MPSKKKTDKLAHTTQAQPESTPGLFPLEEPIKRARIARKTKLKLALAIIIVAALIIYLIFDVMLKGPLTSFLMNREQIVETVKTWGIFAPLLYIILQIIQTVVAPIPGQIVASVGGFLFGPWGILWTLIGSLIGCWIVFYLARRFGRPLLERIFKKSAIDKFDFIISADSAAFIVFAIFLLPGFPDDIVCYIAGLTKISIRKLILLVALGRLPTIIVTNFVGAGITDNFGLVAGISVISVFILGVFVWKREWIIDLLKKKH